MSVATLLLLLVLLDAGRQEQRPESAVGATFASDSGQGRPPRSDERTADDIVSEIEDLLPRSRLNLPHEEFVRTHRQLAALVDDLRRLDPGDARLSRFLPERWISMRLIEGLERGSNSADSRRRLHVEIREVLDTTSDPNLKKEAQFLETLLRFQEPIDGPAAASLAVDFARNWPDDNRSGELLFGAAGKLDEAWFLRIAFIVALMVCGGLTALVFRKRPSHSRKLFLMLGLLSLLVVTGVLVTVLLLPDASRVLRIVEFGLAFLSAGWIHVQRALRSGRVALIVLLAGIGALIVVAARKRRFENSALSQSAGRDWGVAFIAALCLGLALDATLIARESAALKGSVMAEYPDSFRGRMLLGQTRQRERLGQPFELEFYDAISGRPVSMKDFRGKVVVVDFWATWCGPCVGEIPELKRLYAQYHEQGVEFIGVSQDLPEEQGGLEALKAFVAKEQIPWPQFYTSGRDHDAMLTGSAVNDFSEAWGIEGIPAVFLIDTNGNLYSTEARGQLETLIPRLLKQATTSSD